MGHRAPPLLSVAVKTRALTLCLVVLEHDDKLRAPLEPLQEVDHELPDVLRVGRLEGELLRTDRGQGERLSERLVAPEEGKLSDAMTTLHFVKRRERSTISHD